MTTTLAALVLFLATAAAPAELATLPAHDLAEREVVVPRDLPPRPTVFVVGFTKASRKQTAAWSRKIADDARLTGAVTAYQVAVLEDVPGLFRGFVVDAIRSDVPQRLHATFLVVTKQSDDWKALVEYRPDDAAHVVLLDAERRVAWRTNGEPTDAALRTLREHVEALP